MELLLADVSALAPSGALGAVLLDSLPPCSPCATIPVSEFLLGVYGNSRGARELGCLEAAGNRLRSCLILDGASEA